MSIEEYYDKFFRQDLADNFEDLPMRFKILIQVSYDREMAKLTRQANKDGTIFYKLYKKIK